MSLNHILAESQIFNRINATFLDINTEQKMTKNGFEVKAPAYGFMYNTAGAMVAWPNAPNPVKIPGPPVVADSKVNQVAIQDFDFKIQVAGVYEITAIFSGQFTATNALIDLRLFSNEVDLGAKSTAENVSGNEKTITVTTIAPLILDDIVSFRILFDNAANNILYLSLNFMVRQLA